MRVAHIAGCFLAPLLALAQSIQVVTDHPTAVYASGERALFTVKALGADGQPVRSGRLNEIGRAHV